MGDLLHPKVCDLIAFSGLDLFTVPPVWKMGSGCRVEHNPVSTLLDSGPGKCVVN